MNATLIIADPFPQPPLLSSYPRYFLERLSLSEKPFVHNDPFIVTIFSSFPPDSVRRSSPHMITINHLHAENRVLVPVKKENLETKSIERLQNQSRNKHHTLMPGKLCTCNASSDTTTHQLFPHALHPRHTEMTGNQSVPLSSLPQTCGNKQKKL